jgi:hypothetical protein
MTDETNENIPATTEETNGDTHTPTRWTKGMPSPNPRGRPRTIKSLAELREAAREKTGAMLEFLANTALNPKVPIGVRVGAATEILNRGWGRPQQSLDVNHGVQDNLAALLEQIDGRHKIKVIEGTVERPALEAKQSLLDNGQERQSDSVQVELGPRPLLSDSAEELVLSNNSSIRVGTSLRSGTLQYLHISEYGKLCAQYADKAREVRTGALNTLQAGQVVFIESTAEGKEGHFFELCEAGQAKQRMGVRLTPLDFKFHFYPWWKEPSYELDPEGVVIPDDLRKYFERLESCDGIQLSDAKRAWYAKKIGTQLEDMKREFQSTPAEAFEASIEGAYYSKELAQAELQGCIGAFKAAPKLPVSTAWDLGVGDATSI